MSAAENVARSADQGYGYGSVKQWDDGGYLVDTILGSQGHTEQLEAGDDLRSFLDRHAGRGGWS